MNGFYSPDFGHRYVRDDDVRLQAHRLGNHFPTGASDPNHLECRFQQGGYSLHDSKVIIGQQDTRAL